MTAPLRATTTVIGAGAVHAWIRPSTRNADLQATISAVRPDGKETFVQGGWLRANERKLDRRKSRKLEPVLSRAFGETSPNKRARIQIARSKHRASNLLLPVVGVPVSTGLPPCPGLRGEPCRDYRRYKNRAAVRMR